MPAQADSDLAVLQRLLPPAGRDILDVGCGGGAFARELAARGARVTAVEVTAQKLALARAADDGSGARYLVGRAERLPLADATMDVAVFMRTMHHVPVRDMLPALGEARRVLRASGAVYVAEPLPEGDFFALTSLVEDERAVRAAAQSAVADAARAGLERQSTVDYEVTLRLTDVGAFLRRMVSVEPERAQAFAARQNEIAAAFADLGTPGDEPGERRFVQPMRADVLRPVSTESSRLRGTSV